MAILTSKWFLIGAALIAILVFLFINSRTLIHTEIVIDAPPEKVWDVLMDVDKYPEWNPVFVKVDGKLEQGAKLTNHVVEPGKDAVEMGSTVKGIVTHREINQAGGIPGVLTFNHHYYLKPENGGTRVIQHEIDQGLYMYFWDESWVEPAYASVNEALAKRVQELSERETG